MANGVIHAIYQMHKQPVIHPELEERIKYHLCLQTKDKFGTRNKDIPRLNGAIRWLIAVLVDSVRSGKALPIVLPLGHEHYENKPFGCKLVNRVLKAMKEAKCFRIQKALANKAGGNATELKASQWFINAYKTTPIAWVRCPRPTSASELRLTDYDDFLDVRQTVPIVDNLETRAWSLNLNLINEFNQTAPIFLLEDDESIRKIISDRYITFNETRYVRCFCRGRLDRGGRFYSTWWQSIPSEYRSTISIDSKPVVELDYSAMAIRLLYSRIGLQPSGDPYDIGLSGENTAEKRRILKRFLLAITNDKNAKYRLNANDYKTLGVSHTELVRRLNHKHSEIRHFFFTDSGVDLQFVDSGIAEQVMLKGIQNNILILCVHDSFIAQEQHEQKLREIMFEVYIKATGFPPVIRKEERKRVPQVGLASTHSRYSSHFQLTFMANEIGEGRIRLTPGGLADLASSVVSRTPAHP